MVLKLLICSALLYLVVADVKHLSRTYLPTILTEVVEKPSSLKYLPPAPQKPTQDAVTVKYFAPISQDVIETPNVISSVVSRDVPDNTNNEVIGNDLRSEDTEKLSKQAGDPDFGGFPGPFPNPGFSAPGFPGQFYPRPGFPPQGLPGQGYPGPVFPPSAGFINPGFPPQGFPGQGLPGQGFPGQNFPGQGFPGQGFPGQGFPGQSFPGQIVPGQGFPGQGFPVPGFGNPSFPGQGFPNYPLYFSNSEQLHVEGKEENADDKLRVRLIASDTQYDDKNGGYLYKKPSVAF